MTIKRTIIEQLCEADIRIDHVFYTQLLIPSGKIPAAFWETFESDKEDILAAFELEGSDLTEYNHLETENDLLEFLVDHPAPNVLLQFSMPVYRNFRFSEAGKFAACSSGWGTSTWRFVAAPTIEEALSKAMTIRERYFERCMSEALSEVA